MRGNLDGRERDSCTVRGCESESSLEGNDMLARLDAGDALTDGLDDAGALVSEDDGECALGVLAGERVCICGAEVSQVASHPTSPPPSPAAQADRGRMRRLSFTRGTIPGRWTGQLRTCVADTGVVDLDAHLVGPGWRHLDGLDAQVFACLPSHGRLAGDGLNENISEVSLLFQRILGSPVPIATQSRLQGAHKDNIDTARGPPFQLSTPWSWIGGL